MAVCAKQASNAKLKVSVGSEARTVVGKNKNRKRGRELAAFSVATL